MPVDNELRKRAGLPEIADETPQKTETEIAAETANEGLTTTDDVKLGGTLLNDTSLAEPTPLSEADLFAQLQRLNPNIKSIDEIKNFTTAAAAPEDEETKKKNRQKQMISWALQNDIVPTDQYNKFQIDSAKPPRQIVYEDYAAKRKAAGATPEKIDREFQLLYHEKYDDMDEDETVVAQAAKLKMEEDAKRILKKGYPEMYSLEKKYDEVVTASQRQNDYEQTLRQNSAAYDTDFESIVSAAKKVDYVIGDTEAGSAETVEFEFKEDVIASLRKEFLGKNVKHRFIENYDKADLQDAIKWRLMELTDEQRIGAVAKRYYSQKLSKDKKKRNNLEPDDPGAGIRVPEKDLEMYARVGLS